MTVFRPGNRCSGAHSAAGIHCLRDGPNQTHYKEGATTPLTHSACTYGGNSRGPETLRLWADHEVAPRPLDILMGEAGCLGPVAVEERVVEEIDVAARVEVSVEHGLACEEALLVSRTKQAAKVRIVDIVNAAAGILDLGFDLNQEDTGRSALHVKVARWGEACARTASVSGASLQSEASPR